jgi:hypothetical protein
MPLFFSVFVLPCADSGLGGGLMPRQRSPIKCVKIHSFQINSEREQARRPNKSNKEEEEEEEE